MLGRNQSEVRYSSRAPMTLGNMRDDHTACILNCGGNLNFDLMLVTGRQMARAIIPLLDFTKLSQNKC